MQLPIKHLTSAYGRIVKVIGAMQTADGAWRVEAVRQRGHWYRIVHGDSAIEHLSIASVERILREAGVDLSEMVDAAA